MHATSRQRYAVSLLPSRLLIYQEDAPAFQLRALASNTARFKSPLEKVSRRKKKVYFSRKPAPNGTQSPIVIESDMMPISTAALSLSRLPLCVSLASLLLAAAAVELDDAVKTLRKAAVEEAAWSVDESASECYLSSSEPCLLADMPEGASTLVYTGGDTQCIFEDSTPYRFQVVRGDPGKLVLYFQGGGACWNEASTMLGLCSTDANPSSLIGMFSRDAEDNPRFWNHTFVQVLYCSGDVHGGNSTRSYVQHTTGGPVTQVGAINTAAVLDWLAEQKLGTLDELVVAGCSAGSVGAQVWADVVLSTVPSRSSAMLFDSFTGLFPPTSQGPLIKDFGLCGSDILVAWPELEAKCEANELTLQDMVGAWLGAHPDAPFAHLNSKTDEVQESYYVAIGALNRSLDAFITPRAYYKGINEIYEGYHAFPNHVAFLVDSSQHCYTNTPLFATASTTGLTGQPVGAERMQDWVGALPLDASRAGGTNLTWACAGDRLFLDNATAEDASPDSYCDALLTGRVIMA